MRVSVDVDSGSNEYTAEYPSTSQAVELLKNIVDESVAEISVRKKGTTDLDVISGTDPPKYADNRAGWFGKLYIHNPAYTAYKIILLLEQEKVPRMFVDEILEAVKSILGFQEVAHTPKNERNPNFPK